MRLLTMPGMMEVLIPSAPVCALGQLPLISKGSLWGTRETDCDTSLRTHWQSALPTRQKLKKIYKTIPVICVIL